MKEESSNSFVFDVSLYTAYVPPEKTGDELADQLEDLVKYRAWHLNKTRFDEWVENLVTKKDVM